MLTMAGTPRRRFGLPWLGRTYRVVQGRTYRVAPTGSHLQGRGTGARDANGLGAATRLRLRRPRQTVALSRPASAGSSPSNSSPSASLKPRRISCLSTRSVMSCSTSCTTSVSKCEAGRNSTWPLRSQRTRTSPLLPFPSCRRKPVPRQKAPIVQASWR